MKRLCGLYIYVCMIVLLTLYHLKKIQCIKLHSYECVIYHSLNIWILKNSMIISIQFDIYLLKNFSFLDFFLIIWYITILIM